jgi:hypothetical protein
MPLTYEMSMLSAPRPDSDLEGLVAKLKAGRYTLRETTWVKLQEAQLRQQYVDKIGGQES